MKSLKNTKVLLLGGYGFIGSNLAHYLMGSVESITIIDNLEPKSGGNINNLSQIKNKLSIIYGSILEMSMLSQEIAKCDLVINCAASTSHTTSMSEPFFDLDVNLKGMLNILEAIRRFNPTARLIHFGTTTQFGQLQYFPATEMHPEFPNDIYSANKSLSEKYALLYWKSYGVKSTILRISNTYGPYASIDSPLFTFNNYFIGLALQGKEIKIYGDGSQKRNFLYVGDLFSAVKNCLYYDESIGETMLITSDRHYSITEIANLIISIAGSGKVNKIPWPAVKKATEVGDQIFDNTKAKNIIKWKPKVDLIDGITQTIKFYNKYKPYYIN